MQILHSAKYKQGNEILSSLQGSERCRKLSSRQCPLHVPEGTYPILHRLNSNSIEAIGQKIIVQKPYHVSLDDVIQQAVFSVPTVTKITHPESNPTQG